MDELRRLEEELAWLEVEKGEHSQEYRDLAQQYWMLWARIEVGEVRAGLLEVVRQKNE